MKAVVYTGPQEFTVSEISTPGPGPGEVRLRVLLTGVCGTDVHLHDGEFGPVYPLTPGHEVVGEVESLGSDVNGLELGQRVVFDNMTACGTCYECQRARPAFCLHLKAKGVYEAGGAAEFLIVTAAKCFPVGDLDPELAILAEPTACAMHGMDRLDLRPGSEVLLLGAGPTALILTQLLRSGGAGRVTVAAPTQFKLDIAAKLGADRTFILDRRDPEANVNGLMQLAPAGFDVVVDATGSVEVLSFSLQLLAIGGTLFIYGVTGEQDVLPMRPYDVFRRELTIKGSFSQAFSFDRGVQALLSGRVRSDGIITHHFPLDHYGEAIDAVRNDRSCLKAVIDPRRER